jgi:hypothetical protein
MSAAASLCRPLLQVPHISVLLAVLPHCGLRLPHPLLENTPRVCIVDWANQPRPLLENILRV